MTPLTLLVLTVVTSLCTYYHLSCMYVYPYTIEGWLALYHYFSYM